jgi:nitrite reductase/ring-hydroxylating ferredoxin subunit
MSISTPGYVRVADLAEVKAHGTLTSVVDGHRLALFAQGDRVYAVDNRCPHMGFPLERGTVADGILTCHWHHARFDLAGGGTFDPWAGDLRRFPVEVRDGAVWVDLAPAADLAYQHQRLQEGLERDIPLVLAKTVIALGEAGVSPVEPLRAALTFGVRYRRAGWGQGLTILACLMNLLPDLDPDERPRALYHGLAAVARDSDGAAPRFALPPLPGPLPDLAVLKRWFRRFVEVRDAEGAERCVVSAVRAGADSRQMADMLFAAATDHRYIQGGHALDFTNKAFEALDLAGWQLAEPVLAGLVPAYAGAGRMEEANAWRYPVDLIAILHRAFEALPAAQAEGRRHGTDGAAWLGRRRAELIEVLLGEDPAAIADLLLTALRAGVPAEQVGRLVAYAAALRIARFHTSNEFSDWDTALHTFTFANAVQRGLERAPSAELVRGVFDAAMSIYLDRFLNVPAARLPAAGPPTEQVEALLAELAERLDRQQQVGEAAELAARYLYAGGALPRLQAALGSLLLREDRDFHTIQAVEASFRQLGQASTEERVHLMVAAARYLAAHAPTVRAQGQTYQIARRLQRGEQLFSEEP